MRNKDQLTRLEIIDSELSRKEYVKTNELVEAIEREDIQVSTRTIQKDIQRMRASSLYGYDAPIEEDKQLKAWRYTDRNFTIKAFGLKEEDIRALLFYHKAVEQFKNHAFFKTISKAIEKVLNTSLYTKKLKGIIANRAIIETEVSPLVRGVQFIDKIARAISENIVLNVEYQKHGEQKEARKFRPYYLKEKDQLWYVVSKNEGDSVFKTFALDRLISVEFSHETFEPEIFNPHEYFKHTMGITVHNDCEIKEIILSFTPRSAYYLKTIKFHETQKAIIDNDTEFRIKIAIIPSFEFYSKVLSYGESVTVISPKEIRMEVKDRIRKALDNYSERK